MLSIAITYVQHRPVADRCQVKKLLLGTQSSDTDGHLYIVGSLTIDPLLETMRLLLAIQYMLKEVHENCTEPKKHIVDRFECAAVSY